ncbi:penicillin-binding protein 1C [Acidovorax sp. Leaf76]|uniref:penicillin-binding protein 1C n=1 Tax=unclassified Acidovorax TaxID=2684926 RepID=UPI0006FBE322|nr:MULTISPECIES: penicillin-binding protein 1C [unclassified Acidovorax]KQO13565.1 penicillin-binding protein 1C [Acidovorax sp. Leaf76]KQO30785.1 penicillin-binding protein 1C [Acidovorax sp. Leaf84]KQS27196.1 penicillin-binding protein 1C [Acidovorax sp. Leaf191]
MPWPRVWSGTRPAAALPAVAVACLLLVGAPRAHALPSYDEVRADFKPSDTLILSREGEVLQRLRTDPTVRRGQWVALADVSPALRTALVLSEDKRFFEHSGVDWRAASAAAWGNLWNQRTRGASTITMQLAGLLDGDWRQGPGGRTVVQKLGQTVAAQVLDRRWRKDQVLEAYLNLVPFRSELVGIDALSRTLFGKAAHGLDDREAAVAAALVRAPNARPALVAQRACGVLRDMQAQPPPRKPATTAGAPASPAQPPRVDCDALDLFTTAALQRRAFDASEGVAPHFARYLLRQRDKDGAALPERVQSTVRAPLQRFAVSTLQQHLRELRGRNVEDGAVLVLDNATGAVLAWVGSSGQLSQASEVDGVLALRQPGSTLKPFLYGQAIAERRLTAASLVDDSPAHIATAGGLYIPQNYDRQFKGWVSVRTALAASLNVPAVRTLVMVTPDAFHRQLRAVGMPLRESGDYFGYSLALGSPEVPLVHLTNAFRTLANGGRASAVDVSVPARSRSPVFTAALDPRAAFIVGDILSDGNARARTFGTDSVLATRFWTAVKTGTSKDMRDNWAVGWSERYTVGVWVGNASGAAMHDVSGTSGAAPIWGAVMGFLHAREPSRAPKAPAGLHKAAVRFGPGPAAALADGRQPLEAARDEWFLQGTQQPLFAIDSIAAGADGVSAKAVKDAKNAARKVPDAPSGAPARITAPAGGTIIALDPDIPPARQRLQFTATGEGLLWRMDGKPLGQGPRVAWLPWPGRHVVQITDAKGEVLDEIRIEVRGAGVASKPPRGAAN